MKTKLKLDFFLSPNFWHKTISQVVNFVPYGILPASLVTGASIVVLFALGNLLNTMKSSVIVAGDFLQAAAIGGASVFVCILVTVWATWIWLLRLTAFCRSYLRSESADRKILEAALQEVSSQQSYLAKVWLVASCYLLLGSVPFCLCYFVQVVAVSSDIQSMIGLSIAPWVLVLAQIGLFVLGMALLGYSFVTMVISSELSLPVKEVGKKAFEMSLYHAKEITLLGILVVVLNILMSLPQLLLALNTREGLSLIVLVEQAVAQLWLGFSSLFIWTVCLSPFCKLLQDDLLACRALAAED